MGSIVGGIILIFFVLGVGGLILIVGFEVLGKVNEFFDERTPKARRQRRAIARHDEWRRANPELARKEDELSRRAREYFRAIDGPGGPYGDSDDRS